MIQIISNLILEGLIDIKGNSTALSCWSKVLFNNDNDNDNDNEISFILTQVNTSLLATLLGLLCGIANTIT